ncbi:hypothetical protein GW17_00048401 [Ensete ventricosum]|nr:hypothetical protein GW17_00048401 [Ensete ventricosum]
MSKASRKEGSRPWPGHLQGGDRLWPRSLAGVAACIRDARRGDRLQRDTRRSGDLQCGTHPQRWPPAGITPVGRHVDQVAARGCRPELLNMLREAENTIKKEKLVLYIGETNRKKGRQVRSLRRTRAQKDRVRQKVAKKYPAKDKGQCFHCG